MFNAVGGSTIHWSAHFPRYHPSDFRVRSLDGVGDDWPLELRRAGAVLRPERPDDRRRRAAPATRRQPPRSARQTPPIPLGPLGEAMARGFDRLGWHWWPSDAAIITAPFGDRPGLQQLRPLRRRLPDRRAIERRRDLLAAGAAARRRAADPLPRPRDHRRRAGPGARRPLLRRDGRAPGAARAAGRSWPRTASARRACCSTRARGAFPDGLANRAGMVGKCLMFHPFATASGVLPDRVESYQRADRLLDLQPRVLRDRRVARLRARLHDADRARDRAAQRGARRRRRRRGCPGARGHHAAFAERFAHVVNMGLMGEDLPETVNEVDARPEPDRRRRHPGAAGALPPEREQPADDGVRRRAGHRGARSGRRHARC